jgi:iron complex outermembrane receptor protein
MAQAAAPAAAKGAEVETVIVTAQKRSENLQSVPITVAAITSANLAARGVTDTRSLSSAVPGVTITQSNGGGTAFIRGIGNPNGSPGDQGATAFYIDGVYIPDLWGDIFSFNNIDRVEVLKGPQGTLFGRNAAGGVVQIITKDPSAQPQADVMAGYGAYDTAEASLYAGGALASDLRGDLAAIYSDQMKGYGENLYTGGAANLERHWGVRTKLIWTPSNSTTVTAEADFLHTFGNNGNAFRLLPGEVGLLGAPYPGFYDINSNTPTYYRADTGGGSLTVDQDLGFASLTSISAYRFTNAAMSLDQDFTTRNIFAATADRPDRAYSEELRLASEKGAPITWLVGLYFLDDAAGYSPITFQGSAFTGTGYAIYDTQRTTSYAVFGQATKDLVWDTDLTLGLRYSVDDETLHADQVSAVPAYRVGPYEAASQFPSETYRAALDHRFTSDISGYVSYNRGFKAGLYNLNAPFNPPVKPETVDAYEVGLKSQFLDNRLQVDLAGFYDQFTNIQLRQFGATAGAYLLLNAAQGESKGLDLDFQAVATDHLRFTGGLELLDATYTRFPDAPFTYPKPAVCSAPGTSAPGHSTGPSSGGDLTCLGDASGKTMIGAPPVTASLSAQYKTSFSAGDLLVTATGSYNGGFFFELDNRLKQPPYALLNTTIAWVPVGGHWELELWGENLTGARYYMLEQSAALADFGAPAPPATFGARVKLHFR